MDTEYYYYDDETGMGYWHDGEYHRSQCHDAVGLVTEHWQTLDEFLEMWPQAEQVEA